jgi:hypothetical protein
VDTNLLRAVRTVIQVDSDPVRQTLFRSLMRSRALVRLVYTLHERLIGTWAGALLVSAYGLAAYISIGPPRNHRARVLAVATHANAKRQVAILATWIDTAQCAWIRIGPKIAFSLATFGGLARLARSRRLRQMLRIVRRLDERYGFLIACRASSAIAWYVRTSAIIAQEKPGAVLVSSDSNPEEVGFVAAARASATPQVFVSHAYPTPFSPPLEFSLSILEGEAAVRARQRKGRVKGAILLGGVEGDSGVMDAGRFSRQAPVIGIFTPKALSWTTLTAIIEDCRTHFGASRIVIRWHPSMLEPPRLNQWLTDLSGVVESDRTARLQDVARQCDWVIADENSNVHLPVLKLGIPTVAVKQLGLYPPSRSDMYGLAADRIVFPAVASVCEIRTDEFSAFFSGDWPARFECYDASYLRGIESISRAARDAINQLCERGSVVGV